MQKSIKVAICGAGRGGMTEAADLTLMGHEARLFELPRFSQNIEAIRDRGGIAIKGQTASGKMGKVMPNVITTHPAEALNCAEVIMITCPVFGHQAFMDALIPHFQDGQVVVFNTGYWSSLRFQSQVKAAGANVILAETMLLPYLTFTDGPASVNVHATKQEVFFAAMPAVQTDLVLPKLQCLYPQFTKATNVLETNLKNINPIAHAPISLLNAGTIENLSGQPFYFYRYGATRRVCQAAEVLDQERVSLCDALGVSTETMLEQMSKMYGHVGAVGDSLYDAFKGNEADQEFAFNPADILLEVAREDVPYGLMPLAALARQLDIPTPTIDAIIHLQSLVSGEDFQTQGLSLDDLGLSGMSVEQMRNYVEFGV